MTEPKKRVFIAINLPDEVKENLIQYIAKIKKINFSHNLKYVKPQGLHLTLHFLGYLTDEQIEQVKTAISQVIENKQSFSLTINQLKRLSPGDADYSQGIKEWTGTQVKQFTGDLNGNWQ